LASVTTSNCKSNDWSAVSFGELKSSGETDAQLDADVKEKFRPEGDRGFKGRKRG
jgi:hypothetical protein